MGTQDRNAGQVPPYHPEMQCYRHFTAGSLRTDVWCSLLFLGGNTPSTHAAICYIFKTETTGKESREAYYQSQHPKKFSLFYFEPVFLHSRS